MIKKRYLLLLTGLLFLLGSFTISCTSDSEQQEVISFTQNVLDIEAKRSELTEYFARQQRGPGRDWLVRRFFLEGMPADANVVNAPASGLEGMVSLRKRLLFLDCPQSLLSIKQSLLEIYQSEIELGEFQLDQTNLPWIPPFGEILVLCEINKDNVGDWKQIVEQYEPWTPLGIQYAKLVKSGWFTAQEFRLEVYTRWAEILREHGIDPAEEGFTELVG